MKTCLLNLFVLWKKNRSSIIANNVIHEQRGFVSSLRLLLPNAPPLSSQLWFNTGHLFKMTYICRKSDMLDGESVMWHDPISAARRKKKKGTAPWMIHVSRLSNRIDEFSEYEQMRKKGNPITYRRVENRYVNSEFAWRQRMGRGERYGSEFAFDGEKNYRNGSIIVSIRKKSFPRRLFPCCIKFKII